MTDREPPVPAIAARREATHRVARTSIVAVLCVGAIVAWMLVLLQSNVVYLSTVSDAVARPTSTRDAHVPHRRHGRAGTSINTTSRRRRASSSPRAARPCTSTTAATEPTLFKDCAPVVAEGHWARATTFDSDRLLIKHGTDYEPPSKADEVDPAEHGRRQVREGRARLRAARDRRGAPRCSASRRSAPGSHLQRPRAAAARAALRARRAARRGRSRSSSWSGRCSRTTSRSSTSPTTSRARRRGLYTFTGRVGRARGLDPAVGARALGATSRSRRGGSATAPTIRSSRGRRSSARGRCCSSSLLMLFAGQPVQGR